MRAFSAVAFAFLLGGIAIFGTAEVGLAASGKGMVVGGLEACSGLATVPTEYAAGDIVVTRGSAPVIAEQRIGEGDFYVFTLDAGSYRLEGHYAGGVPTFASWTDVQVDRGTISRIDIPDRCI